MVFFKKTPTDYELLIAGYNAPYAIKKRADIICTGHDDQIKINSALESLEDYPISPSVYNQVGVCGWFKISDKVIFPPRINMIGVWDIAEGYNRFLIDDEITTDNFYMFDFPAISGALGSQTLGFFLKNIGVSATHTDYSYPADNVLGTLQPVHTVSYVSLFLDNCYFKHKTVGLEARSHGGYIKNCGFGSSTTGTSLNLHYTHQLNVMNNRIFCPSSGVGVRMESGNDALKFTGNRFINTAGTAYISDDGSNTRIHGLDTNLSNVVYFRNTGLATVLEGNTSVVVTHNMALTPVLSNINLIPSVNNNMWVTDITATTFTINIDAAAPSGGVVVGWGIRL